MANEIRASDQTSEAERWLQISIRLLAVLGAMMLGITQSDLTLAVLSCFACLTSYYFTDRWGWFRLNRYVGYVAMIAAAAVSLGDFLRHDPLRQLLAISSLLVYVQIVLFYQAKQPRVYEQIGIFCALQVIVASLLTTNMFFGAVLVIYLVVALTACASFALYREQLAITGQRTSVPRANKRLESLDVDDKAPAWRKTLGKRPVVYFPLPVRRWSIQLLDTTYASQIAMLAVAALVFSMVYFYRSPRNASAGPMAQGLGGGQVGFSDQPTLDEIGRVLQSDKLVMRVWYTDHRTGAPIKPYTDPYLRGVVLTNYRFIRGQGIWEQPSASNQTPGDELGPVPDAPNLVRQRVLMEPSRNSSLLFSVSPTYQATRGSHAVRIRPDSRQLFWTPHRVGSASPAFSYSILTNAFRFGIQSSIVSHDAGSVNSETQLNEREKQRLLDFPSDRFPKLAKLVEQILVDQEVDRSNRMLVAQTLRNHFQSPGRYTYTLNLDMQRDRSVDPLEAFVADHRRGHCQYFAGALTLMLRSQGIPARMVIGYKPEEYNAIANYYIVRERDAHAWVEAYLEPDDYEGSQQYVGTIGDGAWVRLDPTPGAASGDASAPTESLIDQVGNAVDYAHLLWQDYVLGSSGTGAREFAEERLASFDGDGEEEDPTDPAISLASRVFVSLRDLLVTPTSSASNLRLAFVLALLLALVVAAGRARRNLLARFMNWLRGKDEASNRARHRVEFFERFEAICEKRGIRRGISQTQREFAESARKRIGGEHPELFSDPIGRLTDLFYRVRFGGHDLNAVEQQQVEQALMQLEMPATPSP